MAALNEPPTCPASAARKDAVGRLQALDAPP